jgi:chlorobactene glucosyltransferase
MINTLYLIQTIILIVVGTALLILLVNMFTIRRLETYPSPTTYPCVSILIPARDEAENIEHCVRSCLVQDYPDFEVIVLDDHSTDQTWSILKRLAAADGRLKIMQGQPLPKGWLGKFWACNQLGQAATGELLLFIDADVWFQPQALTNAVSALQTDEADLLAVIPREVVGSWAERLTVAILNFAMLWVYPYPLAARVSWPFMVIANGQFMLFRRKAYHQIGGYEAMRNKTVDDIPLARNLKAYGLRWRLANGVNRVFCRMYHGLAETWFGFSKGVFPSFDYNLFLFLPAILGLAIIFLEPLGLRLLSLVGYNLPSDVLILLDVSIVLAMMLWGIFYAWLKISPYAAVFYPAAVVLAVAIGVNSIYVAFAGQNQWKGRAFPNVKDGD